MTKDCRTPIPATTQGAPVANQKAIVTCYECGKQGHYRSECSRLKNQNRRNQARNGESRGRAYVLGGGEANQNPNVVMGTFLLNNNYASIIFDTSADKSFVSTTFSPLIDITPTALDTKYVVEFRRHHGIDWLTKYHTVIICDEKIVHVLFGNEILTIQGDRSDGRIESRLNIISCTKTQKYIQKGCHVFLAQITEKKTEKKSEEKRLEDVLIVCGFQEIFPGELAGIPLT
ncbi:putative reverse transcriptase domain-containing protein [Tanacetum coccineum]